MRIVFDLDGTLSDGKHREHFITGETKDWDAYFAACDEDQPICHVLEVLDALASEGSHEIEIWSGRGEGPNGSVRDKTLAWLERQCVGIANEGGTTILPIVIVANRLLMRGYDDYRPDVELKRGWLETARGEGRAPDLVFDDRDKVVAMWRAEGIPCFQVAPGDF